MLFSTADDPQAACKDLVSKYRSCMASYGFNIA
jgi:cytochrome c oxidase assembly protein subunit 17